MPPLGRVACTALLASYADEQNLPAEDKVKRFRVAEITRHARWADAHDVQLRLGIVSTLAMRGWAVRSFSMVARHGL
jgi:hypothetical protein